MKKDILVITATLGDRPSLKKTIESVREIGGARIKHIIVCPESRIIDIKKKYNIDCLPEIPGKKGIYAALNHGFQTYGRDFKYLTFINDDDHWLPSFKYLIDEISRKDLELVYGKTKFVDCNFKTIGHQTSFPIFGFFLPLLKSGIVMLTQQATLIKSSLYFSVGGFDESYKLAADTKFWSELSIRRNIRYKYINKECAAYMIQDNQLSSDHATQYLEHKRLFTEVKTPNINIVIAKILFRIFNLHVYFSRFIHGKLTNPFKID